MRSQTLPLTFHGINTLVPPQTRSLHEFRAEWQTADGKCKKKCPQVMIQWPSSSPPSKGEHQQSTSKESKMFWRRWLLCSEQSNYNTAAIYKPEQGHTAGRLCKPMTTTTWSLLPKLQSLLQQGRGFSGSFTHSHGFVLWMYNPAGLNSPDSKPNSQNHQEWVRLTLGNYGHWKSLRAPNTQMSWISCMEYGVFIWLLGSLLWDFYD